MPPPCIRPSTAIIEMHREVKGGEVKGDSHQIWRTQRVQVNVASLRLFLRSSTGPNRAFEPQSLGRVRDPVRIAEGPTHDFGFSILDCGLMQHESPCRKRLRGERGSSSIAFMRGSGRAHPLSGTWETWMAPNVQDCGDSGRIGPPHSQSLVAGKALTENPKSISGIRQDSCAVVLFSQSRAASVPGTGVWVSINCPSG